MAFNRRETTILLIGDFLILVGSLWAALLIRNLALPSSSYFESVVIPFLPMFLLSLVVFYVAGLYEKQTRPIRSVMGIRIFGAQAATVAIAAILFFILPLSIAPKTILVLYLLVSVLAESLWRFHRMKRELKEQSRVPAVLVGTGPSVLELYEEVQNNGRYLIRFSSFINTRNLRKGELRTAMDEAIQAGARMLVADTFDSDIALDVLLVSKGATQSITIVEFASLYEEIFDRVPLEHLDAAQLLESLPEHRSIYDASKRLFDLLLALVGSILALPFIAVAAVILFLQNGTSFIYQERIGKGGRAFRLVKMRSRFLPYDDRGDPELQKMNQVTPLGRILRKTRIDELPQLWNVIVGDLSFIGPRPELPKLTEVYEQEIPQYRLRYLATPGLSGWAQIHDYDAPRGGADVVRTRRKLSFDLYYLKHRSFGVDIAIAVKTLRALLSFSGT